MRYEDDAAVAAMTVTMTAALISLTIAVTDNRYMLVLQRDPPGDGEFEQLTACQAVLQSRRRVHRDRALDLVQRQEQRLLRQGEPAGHTAPRSASSEVTTVTRLSASR